jgi:hypothetical protein
MAAKEESPEIPEAGRKKRGRPKHKPTIYPTIEGVLTAPKAEYNFMEFRYDYPEVFKKLWTCFKGLSTNVFHINFSQNYITIWCRDHNRQDQVKVKIDCSKVTYYHCREEMDIGLINKNISPLMLKINKTYNYIQLSSMIESKNKTLEVHFNSDSEVCHGPTETTVIDLIHNYNREDTNEQRFLGDDYTVMFTLGKRRFKDLISDAMQVSGEITIKQDGKGEPLLFEYFNSDKRTKSTITIKEHEDDTFRSKLEGDETLCVSFKTKRIKPISSVMLADTVTIYADEHRPLMVVARSDPAVELRVLAEIIDNRNKIDIPGGLLKNF